MRVDLALLAAEKMTPVLEGISDNNIPLNSSGLDDPVIGLHDQTLETMGIEKKAIVRRALRFG
jgi:hypothetical protein